jgi:hypothetical protein
VHPQSPFLRPRPKPTMSPGQVPAKSRNPDFSMAGMAVFSRPFSAIPNVRDGEMRGSPGFRAKIRKVPALPIGMERKSQPGRRSPRPRGSVGEGAPCPRNCQSRGNPENGRNCASTMI